MRKISLIAIVALFSTLLFSCKDDLKLSPHDKIDEELALKTKADFEAALRGAYFRLLGETDGDYYPRKMIVPDVLSDNLIMNQSGRKSLQLLYQFKLDGNSTWSSLLFYAYSATDRANRIIDNIDVLPEGADRDDVLAQAKAIRALAHFDVVSTYAPHYNVVGEDEPNSGVPIKDVVNAAALPARNTLKETFDFIINELKDAKELASNDRSKVANGRFNKAAISALLARVYLYQGDYPNAKTEAQDAIDLVGSDDLAIASLEEFPNIWTDESAGEAGVLFKIIVTQQDRVMLGPEYNQTAEGIRSEYSPTFEFFNRFKNNDIRKTAYLETSPYDGVLYNHVIKYVGRPGSPLGVVDVKVIRGAEVYLTLAEAAARTGDDVTALEALDAVRERRYEDFASDNETGSGLLNAILLERRLELAFEGHRYYDLKRLGLPIVRSATEGDEADGSGIPAPVSTQNIEANSHLFTLPIPTAERQANPNFTQSPDY